MQYVKGALVELPRRGKALIVTDLHGNFDNFTKIMALWDECADKDCHLIITGDFIQATSLEKDRSLEIIDEVQYQYKNNKNFHLLLGNHEWAMIAGITIYKGGLNQSSQFERLIQKNFNNSWEEKLEEYISFFKKLPIAVRTANKVFISHAGPSNNIKTLYEISEIKDGGFLDNQPLYELLWNREGDYDKNDVNIFLEKMGCQTMIVGHTPVDGIKLIGNQLVVSVSATSGKRAYVELDLEKVIDNGHDLLKMVKYFQ